METDCELEQLQRYNEYVVINNERIYKLTLIVEKLEKNVAQRRKTNSILTFVRYTTMTIWIVCFLYVIGFIVPDVVREIKSSA